MKAVLTVKMKGGYLVAEREIESLTMDEVFSATIVDDDGYGTRDKVGRIAADILKPLRAVEEAV